MDNYFNFKISDKSILTRQALVNGATNFVEVCNLIKGLPYGRNTERGNYSLVLMERKGTCSTKHAFLKQIAIDNGFDAILLCIGIYKMNNKNTKGVASVLDKYKLSYLPEAHTYLKYKEKVYDFTSPKATSKFYDSVMYEESIEPLQIGEYKTQLHQQFLRSWIEENDIPYRFKELWQIREEGILALSQ